MTLFLLGIVPAGRPLVSRLVPLMLPRLVSRLVFPLVSLLVSRLVFLRKITLLCHHPLLIANAKTKSQRIVPPASLKNMGKSTPSKEDGFASKEGGVLQKKLVE